jgi:glyoxylase-like metal-dependent hydrolase (beta-lactamase superfamily II)
LASTIADGVWWLHGTRGCNVYLARARDGSYAIVDTGFADNAEPIMRQTREIAGADHGAVILLTHFHFDHSGSARELAEKLGTDVRGGADDCKQVDGRFELQRNRIRGPRRRRGLVAGSEPIPVRPLEDGEEVLPGIVAVATPGHTAGSYCFVVEDAGVALVGDLVISHSDGLSRTLVAANSDDVTYLESIRSFAERVTDIGCPGHGQPVMDGFGEQLRLLSEKPRERLRPWHVPRRLRRLFDFYRFVSRRRKR